MTLLIMLAVVKTYIIVPWWAWTAAWLHASWSLGILISATRTEVLKRRLARQGQELFGGLAEQLSNIPLPIPMMGLGSSKNIN